MSLIIFVILCVIFPNSQQLVARISAWKNEDHRHFYIAAAIGALLALYCFWNQNLPEVEFIYSNF